MTAPTHLAIALAAGVAAAPALAAAEIDGWIEHLAAHRVEIESAFEWPQGGRSIYFRDPARNSLEFAEPRNWGLG